MSRGNETSPIVRVLIAADAPLRGELTTLVAQLEGYAATGCPPASASEFAEQHELVVFAPGTTGLQPPSQFPSLVISDDTSSTEDDDEFIEVLPRAQLDAASLERSLRHLRRVSALHTRLHESDERHELLLRATNDGIWEQELDTCQVRYSPRWASIMGLADDELEPSLATWFSRVHADDIGALRDAVTALQLGDEVSLELEHRITRPDGSLRWVLSRGLVRKDHRGRPVALAGSLTDIDARKLAEINSIDELTGLPSRRVLLERLERSIRLSRDQPRFNFSILFLNLDRFRLLNDSIGLDSADRLLVLLARRLRSRVHDNTLLCRYGGDEFAILMEGHDDFAEAETLARTLQECLSEPFTLDEAVLHTTASIGIANSQPNYVGASEVIRDATIATSWAKRGSSRVATFVSTMHQVRVDMHRTETQLRKAIKREEFVVYYQPIVALGSCRLTGFEALVRWNHPRRGIVGPGEFIALAESTGLIIPLGRFVFRSACTQMAAWHREYPDASDVSISINLSGYQLRSPTLITDIEQIIEDTGINPESIKIELTESTLIDEEEAATLMLGRLRGHGIKLYIDDFGTGYSSLSYLHRFAIDGLKIDKSFVDTVGQDDRKAAIVPSIVGLAHNLGMRVVAEGVEEPQQARELNLLDCGEAQGYLYSRPVPAAEAALLIERRILCDEDYTK